MIRLPGLIDPHVHLREPGATHKEDFDSGTAAALAGGFTAVLAMPNTQPPLTDEPSLRQAQEAARSKARCDYGIFLGAGADNLSSVSQLASQACGLKMYLDQTYGPLRLEGLAMLRDHIGNWPSDRPLAVHAEGRSLAAALLIATLYERSLHVCHVSRKDEIALIRKAKESGLPVTCEVTPHHLFLTEDDVPRLGAGKGEVRPRLSTAADRDALWANLDIVDCFATDHAPHTRSEKDGEDPPPGFPGLETALGLLLTAVSEDRLTIDDLILRSHTNPRRIYGLPEQHETFIEIDQDAVWEVRSTKMHTRCDWTPFEGMRLQGQVRRVTLRSRLAYADGEVLVPPGYGKDLTPAIHEKIE
ncbi:MAG: amidohydrolase family protein [Anaerolineaceae bacterium]|nr:MAG: amidohydrolase family protein [Anaerolineaceae bacterium]